jgi:adenosylhomocysteine nucleosidase
MRRVAILAATARELAPAQSVCGFVSRIRRGRVGRFTHYIGRFHDVEWHLIKTGIGHQNARLAAEAVVLALAPDALISTGYIGGLGTEGVGALILGTRLQDWTRERSTMTIPVNERLLAAAGVAAREAGRAWSQGPLITVASVVWRASEKQALATASGAIGVDMESAAVGRVAALGKIPFLAVRTVSDKVGEDLPMDLNMWLSASGALRGIIAVIKQPSLGRGFYRLKCQADEADETLRRFFHSFVTALQSCHLSPHSDLSVAVS